MKPSVVMKEFLGYITAKFQVDIRETDQTVTLLVTLSLLFTSSFETFYAKEYNFESTADTLMKFTVEISWLHNYQISRLFSKICMSY